MEFFSRAIVMDFPTPINWTLQKCTDSEPNQLRRGLFCSPPPGGRHPERTRFFQRTAAPPLRERCESKKI
jgi:hypothetical protein